MFSFIPSDDGVEKRARLEIRTRNPIALKVIAEPRTPTSAVLNASVSPVPTERGAWDVMRRRWDVI